MAVSPERSKKFVDTDGFKDVVEDYNETDTLERVQVSIFLITKKYHCLTESGKHHFWSVRILSSNLNTVRLSPSCGEFIIHFIL